MKWYVHDGNFLFKSLRKGCVNNGEKLQRDEATLLSYKDDVKKGYTPLLTEWYDVLIIMS